MSEGESTCTWNQVSGFDAVLRLCLPIGTAPDFISDLVSDTLRVVIIAHISGAPTGTVRHFICFTSLVCVFVCVKQPLDIRVHIRQLYYNTTIYMYV